MMTAIRINNVGKAFPSRQAAREYAATEGGQVVDMAKRHPNFVESQILCAQYGIPNKTPRWIVLFNRIICRHVSLSDAWTNPQLVGKTKVISKKGYLANIARKDRLVRLTKSK